VKNKLEFIAIFCLIFLSVSNVNSKQKEENKEMKKLIDEIIDHPTRMIETMKNSKNIDCSKLVKLFENEDRRLIAFTLSIAYLKYKNFEYEGFDESVNPRTNLTIIQLYYVRNKGLKGEESIKFAFFKSEEKVVFNGITKPID
jgi:hypothetical protein